MGAPSGTNIPLARELNGVRLFVRTIKEPEYLGPVRLANALSKVRRAPSFLRILEEEVNMDFLSRNEELWVAVRSGLLSIPLPVADLAIVRLSEFHPPPMHVLTEHHVQQLEALNTEIRHVLRALIRSPTVGRKLVGNCLTKCGCLNTFERIFYEELDSAQMTAQSLRVVRMLTGSKRVRADDDHAIGAAVMIAPGFARRVVNRHKLMARLRPSA